MAQIIMDHVEKAYAGGVRAVDDLSLDIADGEFMVLVGPSGCGKSTALRSIAGLEEITSGTISIGSRVVNDLPPKDRDIAMVFQNYALYPHMTVEQNLAFGLQLRKTGKAEIARRVTEAARMLGLEPYLGRRPAALSGGQRQRVAMGRAIVRDPAAFLMDEPLSNLDAKLRVQMRLEVSKLQKRLGTTMVYVTHDQTEALTLGDRVAVLRAGVLQQAAPPQELYERPVNLFVAGFIGSPSMNFMSGTLDSGGLRTPLGDMPVSGSLRQEVSTASREVIVGIRPENFQDPSLVSADVRPHGITFQATIDVLESLGAEKYVYFNMDLGKAKYVTELEELARDAGRADSGAASETVVARLDPATRISEGAKVQLWADARALHVFDPATGRNLSVAAGTTASAAGQAGAGAAGHGAVTPSPTSAQTRSSAATQ